MWCFNFSIIMIYRTTFAAISEPILEIITYLFLAFGAISLVGLVVYAVVVFRRVSNLLPEAVKTLNAMSSLLDASASTVSSLDDAIRRTAKTISVPSSTPAPALTTPACACGGTFTPAGSSIGDDGAKLTVKCSKCGCQHVVPLT